MSHLKEYILNNFSPNRPSTCIVNLKKNKDGMLDELEQATSFLNGYYKEISVNQRLHHYLNGIRYAKLCKYCDQPLQIKPFNARISGEFYNGTCDSKECRSKFNGDQSRKGCLAKHGVENISQTPEWREKVKKTNLERRGVEWNTQSKEFIEKTQNSIKLNILSVVRKRKESYVRNYINLHGVEHPMQISKIFERSFYKNFRKKEYILPSGKIVFIQGYENIVLDEIFQKYSENEILINDTDIEKAVGKIFYEHEGKSHRYYPDIFVIPDNKIVEVKSNYTYNISKNINLLKKEACIKLGLDFTFEIR